MTYHIYKNLKQGFTIVELIVVIVVIAILVSLTAVAYGYLRDRTYDTTITTDLQSVAASMEAYKSAKGTYPKDFTKMSVDVPEASFDVSKDSYDVESSMVTADGKVDNLIICSVITNMYAAAAVSKSGHVLSIHSSDPKVVKVDTVDWTNDIIDMCRELGVGSFYQSSPGYAGVAYYSRDVTDDNVGSGWGNWRNGGLVSLDPY
ncbi:MAG: prepilin-type N-terminal cleavage/methylation domain-containing protein [bacterium]|nr:prepilin-type N-terminal cleavage/methylation domain-containing protein [bacterium]